MSTLTYEKLMAGHKDLAAVERIYTENFPEDERVPLECFVKLTTRHPDKYDLCAWYEDGALVAFSYLIHDASATYFHYIARDKASSSKTVGLKIARALVKKAESEGRILYGSVEKPIDPESKTEYAAKRLKMWLRLSLRETGLVYRMNGVELLLLSTEHLYGEGKRVKGAAFLAKINKMRRSVLNVKACTRCGGKGVVRTLRSLFLKKAVCPNCRGMGFES